MPNLDDLIGQTQLATAARRANLPLVPVALGRGPLRTPEPKPHPFGDLELPAEKEEAALHNQIWRFSWDPANPGTFTDVTCNTRGMEMDYRMAAKVFDKVEFRRLEVKPEGWAKVVDLFLAPEYLAAAWWTRGGTLHQGSDLLWPLEAKIDVGLLALFAWEIVDGEVKPLPLAELEAMGDLLCPPPDQSVRFPFFAGDVESAYVCVGNARFICAIELVLGKERPDFVPGELIGFARVGPHALLWSNAALDTAQITILLDRPSSGMACHDRAMDRAIQPLVVTDTNDEHSLESKFEFPLPYTDNLYDYYLAEPYEFLRKKKKGDHDGDHPDQEDGEITLADASKVGRTIERAVTRRTPGVSDDRDIRKVARQGQFDNVHLAARMKAEFTDLRADPPSQVQLDDILMINQCLHDCVHMHVRWSEFLDSRTGGSNATMLHGFGKKHPYQVAGAPQVPRNQTVFLSLPKRSSARYRAVAHRVQPGETTVFCHHGCAYAVDEWPTVKAKLAITALLTIIHERAQAQGDLYGYNFPLGWPMFYWRVRYMGSKVPIERLTCDLKRCLG